MELSTLEVPCSCGKSTSNFSFNYGIEDQHYRLGDKLNWIPGLVPDRTLRYVELQSELGRVSCACGTRDGDILIIRGNILTSVYILPKPNPAAAGDAISAQFKDWEFMLLFNEYGTEKVVATFSRRAYDDYRIHWDKHLAKLHEQLSAALKFSADADLQKRLFEIAFRDRRSYFATGRDYVLNTLAGNPTFDADVLLNFIENETLCPGCSIRHKLRIPFLYGPCNGHRYKLGDAIDWTRPGHIHDVHDPDLHYVELSLPACPDCHYHGSGMATVARGRITDIFLWPKGLLESALRRKTNWFQFEVLDVFLLAREFTPELLEIQIQETQRMTEADPMRLGGFMGDLIQRAKEGFGWKEF
jgi:hypothetical protein